MQEPHGKDKQNVNVWTVDNGVSHPVANCWRIGNRHRSRDA